MRVFFLLIVLLYTALLAIAVGDNTKGIASVSHDGSTFSAALQLLKHSRTALQKGDRGKAEEYAREAAILANEGDRSDERMQKVKAIVARLLSDEFETGGVDVGTLHAEARELWGKGEIGAAVDRLCTEKGVRVSMNERERRDHQVSLETRLRAKRVFQICGFVVVDGLFGEEEMDAIRIAQRAHFSKEFPRYFDPTLPPDPNRPPLVDAGAAERGNLRYELRLPLTAPFTNGDTLIHHPLSFRVLATLMESNQVELAVLSTVSSLPNATAQHWHRDADLLFPTSPHHLPPHAIAQFILLDDVSLQMGPTEFLPGTHLACASKERSSVWVESGGVGERKKEEISDVCDGIGRVDRILHASGSTGSSVFFDYRVVHRGGANRSQTQRHQLYLAYVREWWTDVVNWRRRQTSAFDALSAPERKLLTRLDTQNYILALENELKARGGDIDALQSNYQYHAATFSPTKTTNPLRQ